jgi:hypothetical protein
MQKNPLKILRIYVSPNSRFKGRLNIGVGCWDDGAILARVARSAY